MLSYFPEQPYVMNEFNISTTDQKTNVFEYKAQVRKNTLTRLLVCCDLHSCKIDNFQMMKNCDIFLISDYKIDCGSQSMRNCPK